MLLKNWGFKKEDANKHSVIVFFNYGQDELDDLHALDLKLIRVIENAGVGEYDGHEIAMDGSDGSLYMYGPNAEELFKTVKPTLEATYFMKGAIANLRFGDFEEGVSEIDVEI